MVLTTESLVADCRIKVYANAAMAAAGGGMENGLITAFKTHNYGV